MNPEAIYQITNFEQLDPHFSQEMVFQLDSIPVGIDEEFQILKSDSGTYLFAGCRMELYRWEENSWKNLYQFQNVGYTCKSRLIIKEGNPFLLGGYGFWNSHTDLIEFDPRLGSWSLASVKEQPVNYNSRFLGVSEKSAFLLLGFHNNPRKDIHQLPENQGYILDFESNAWKHLGFDFNLSLVDPNAAYYIFQEGVLDAQDFLAFNAFESSSQNKGLLIFDKNELNFKFFPQELDYNPLTYSPYFMVDGNQVYLQDDKNFPITWDLNEFYSKAKFVGKASILPISVKEVNRIKQDYVIISLVSISLIGLVLFPVFKKRIASSAPVRAGQSQEKDHGQNESYSKSYSSAESSNLLEILDQNKGKRFTVEELDELFDIHQIPNPENKRVKRSRLIKEINTQAEEKRGYKMINRTRSPEDKRCLLYEIK
ncbi:hypothetical protein [Algoriphagus algorifonticola]|uniref:hypothetical protein n=1 Tax=Algoriphagus algorifonticola TaxID=2593007 RepID=UPI00119E888F|nr:hypothetical protein [Algoriphagus algorifonticola]